MRITPKLFLSVTVAALASVAVAVGVYTAGNQWVSNSESGQAAFPLLEQRLNDVASLEITQGGKVLKISRQGENWVAQEPYGYAVKDESIRSFVVALSQARLVEPKTRKSGKYALLGLGDPDDKEAEAKRIRLLDRDGKEIVTGILGRKRYNAFGSGKAGTYVRKPDDPQTWLASLDVKATPDISDWVEREFFKTEKKKIVSVTIEHSGEEPVVVTKKEGSEDDFVFKGLSKDAKLKKSGPKAETIAEAFTDIKLDDLRKLGAKPSSEEQSVAYLETDEGLKVTFRLREDGSDRWITVDASGSGDAGKTAQELNARVKNWEFKIPDWKADNLFRRRSDFLETS